MNKRGEHYVELLESGKDSSEALESAKEALDFVAPLVNRLAVVPGGDAIALGRHDGFETQVESQLPGLVTLVGAVHDQVHRAIGPAKRLEQFASLGSVVRLARRERKRYGRSSIRGNHMNLGGPSASGLADGLRAVFFSAPVPSGCTLTMVLSSATDSILIRTI